MKCTTPFPTDVVNSLVAAELEENRLTPAKLFITFSVSHNSETITALP